ncbi:hypothetical protein AXF42_Ash017086 [Apostasia shenzhenica]|uniref:Uncharacterized protein n=1 Tax=Apostasia shenzhenica TaxID=1088818 RepID=A0A2H9ZV08_9ASPA|nr:hypothetical protein AXF42_Ash017086 [Apostasia shenzhenica]
MASSLLLHACCSPRNLLDNGGSGAVIRSDSRSSGSRNLPSTLHRHGDARLRFFSPMTRCSFSTRSQKRDGGRAAASEEDLTARRAQQAALWAAEAAYVLWLFLLPYAPGDPAWAISSNTVNDLVVLSFNFFFILPTLNLVGIRVIEAPVLHPMAEGLFNFVIGWTFLFAPLLYTDRRRGRFKGSLDLLWGLQMFLTNTFLIPYMAIRLNSVSEEDSPPKQSQLGLLMTKGAPFVGLAGGAVCLFSAVWALFGRADGGFGNLVDRLQFLEGYIGSERLAYAFIWDILLYSIFQPWLIVDNIQSVKSSYKRLVHVSSFLPVFGLVAHLLFSENDEDF